MQLKHPVSVALLGLASAVAVGASAAPASAGVAKVSEITITKVVDVPSTALHRRTIEGETSDYMVITMESALIES